MANEYKINTEVVSQATEILDTPLLALEALNEAHKHESPMREFIYIDYILRNMSGRVLCKAA